MTDRVPPEALAQLGYARSLLKRHSAERSEPAHVAAEMAREDARFVLLAGDVPVLARRGEGATALLDREAGARSVAGTALYLGRADDRPVIARAAPAEAADFFRDDPDFEVLDLRSIAVQGRVPAEELGLLATAKSLLAWHARHGFCANCGKPTAMSCGGYRRDCAACGTEHFPRTDPVVIMLVTRGDRCLLGRQARFVANSYSCLAGFLEPGETIEDAVRREVFEEAGITVGKVDYLASQPWPFVSSLMIGCRGEAETETITLDRAELEDGRWFTRDEVRRMLAREHPDGLITPPPMAIAHTLMRAFVAE
jgi:NAD+ diphosphatase